MPDVISFQAAIEATKGEDRALLIGNGFSAQYFNYTDLLAKSGLEPDTPIRNVFEILETVDFEAVVRSVEDAAIVERAYGNNAHSDELEADAQKVREALVSAINDTHPMHREDLEYESSSAFLSHFQEVYTLNYDLLLYWVNLEKGLLNDGFGLGGEIDGGRFRGPFKPDAHCHIYNLHGGLHLFQTRTGEIFKALHTGEGVVATITHSIAAKKRLPLYVAEGTSKAKVRKINSNAYLRHCMDKLSENSASIFIFGHSADPNDAHIYHAIFGSKAKHVYFGIFQPTADKIKAKDAELAKYKKLGGDDVPYSFFEAETAHVWGGPPAGEEIE